MVDYSKIPSRAKMFSLLPVVGAGFCLLLAAPAFAAENATCVKASDVEIVQLLNAWRAAIKVGNAEQISGLYAPDATLIATKDGKSYKGRDAIRDYYKDFLSKHTMSSIRPATLSAECGKAIVSGPVVYRVTGRRKGTRMLLGGQYQAEFELTGDTWQIVRHSLAADPRAIGDPFGDTGTTKTSPPL